MVRIVSGSKGGLRLKTKNDISTRATLEKVREAMFDMVMIYIPGAYVLDLFSGNGCLGIEALSRGAERCVFNDKDKECVKIIMDNLAYTGLEEKASVMMNDYTECLARLCTKGEKFDIILLDPPYGRGFIEPSVTLANKKDLCSDHCFVIAETDSKEILPEQIGSFALQKKRKYGGTTVHIYRNF